MCLADNNTLMNRTIITKLGVRLAEVSDKARSPALLKQPP
jgi:hypothetical protein